MQRNSNHSALHVNAASASWRKHIEGLSTFTSIHFLSVSSSWPWRQAGPVLIQETSNPLPATKCLLPPLFLPCPSHPASSLSQLCNLQCIREGATFAVPHPECSRQDIRQPAFLSWNQRVLFPAQDPPTAKLTLCYFPDSWRSVLLINFSRSWTWHQWNFHLKILHRSHMHPLVMKLTSVWVCLS